MKSELTENFIDLFQKLPIRIQKTAHKNYKLWKENPTHPGLEFKRLNTNKEIYSIRIGIGWRALGVMNDKETIIWFWVGSHNDYDKLISRY